MPSIETLQSCLRVAFAAFGSQRGRNALIGIGRSIDPNPRVNRQRPHFVLITTSFENGFAKDRANLAMDRYNGERGMAGGL